MNTPSTVKAWQYDPENHSLSFNDVAHPQPRPGAITVRIEAAMVLGYMAEVLDGSRAQSFPDRPFVPGTNAVGTIEAVGEGVYHLSPGQRVNLSPHLVVRENCSNPAQILMGHTARQGSESERLQHDWVDGAFAEVAEWPAAQATVIDVLGDIPAEKALGFSKVVVGYGGLLRIGLQPGETVAVNGASGFYGSGGVLVALAMGASKVFACGRSETSLQQLAELDSRVVPVVLSGDGEQDTQTLRAVSGGGIDAALDLVGANSSQATRCVLRSLNRGGRLAMMGSSGEPLQIDFGEILINDWLIAGQFMYPQSAVGSLVKMVDAGLLSLDVIRPTTFALADLHQALDYGPTMKGLDLTALVT